MRNRLSASPYPIVDPDPSFSRAFENMGVCEYINIGVWGTAGYWAGWFYGKEGS